MVRATGLDAAAALNRPLADVLPDVAARGLLRVMQDVLARGAAEVLAPALHHYLFACAPLEPSATFEHMLQHVTIGPLRDEGGIVGLIVTIEDVTARVEREHQLAEALRRSDDDSAAESADAAAHDFLSLTQLLGEEDWRARRLAVASLAEHGDAIVDALVATLRQQHDNLNVLSSALDLLAVSDIDVVEPLIRFLDSPDANLRIQTALILGERRDRRAIPPLLAHLRDADPNVRFHIIEALGRLHATEASESLITIAEERDFFLAFPAIQALSRVGTPAVAPRLVPLLADEMLRAPVIEALGELGDEEVTGPLMQLLNRSGAPTEVITDALAGLHDRYESRYGAGEHIADLVRRRISATGMQQILDTVQRVGSDRLPGLARVLGWLEGEAVQRALTRLLGQGSVRTQVVEALVRYGSGVVTLLIEQLHAEDLETRQAAVVALGRIGDRRATAPLVAALEDTELAVAVAGALARIGAPDAFEPLMARLGEPDSAVRQAVIAALNSIGHPEMPRRILRLLDDADATVRESALRIAGYFGYPECLERLLACCADEAVSIRRTAVEQLAFFDDARIAELLLGRLQDEAAAVRAAAAMALARVEHPSRVEGLVNVLADPDAWVRYSGLRALAAVGGSNALSAVVARLQVDPAPHVRLAAIEAVGRLRPANALEILEPLTQSGNDDIARAAIAAVGHIDGEHALTILHEHGKSPAPWRRLTAIAAMASRRDARIPGLLEWMAAADTEPEVAGAAIEALAALAGKEGLQGTEASRALVSLAAEPARRHLAIAALGNLPPERIPDVAAGLRHPSPDVRSAIVDALSRMKQREASRVIESALDDPAVPVRLAAVTSLKHLGTRGSQRKLMAVARADPDSAVRHAAIMAVARTDSSGPLESADSN
jgi:HEAT repeat protein